MFSDQQLNQLRAPLEKSRIKPPPKGKFGDYVEAWDCIRVANDIFGFDGWSLERLSMDHLGTAQDGNKYVSYYTACYRIHAGGKFADGTGTGTGYGKTEGEARADAVKESESDGMKRALRCYGNQFGLALYEKDKSKREIDNGDELAKARIKKQIEECKPWHELAKSMVDLCATPEAVENWWGPKDGDTGARRCDLFFEIPEDIRNLFFTTEVQTYRAKLIKDQAAA